MKKEEELEETTTEGIHGNKKELQRKSQMKIED